MTLIHVECEKVIKMKKFKDFRVTVFMIIMIPALLALSIYSKVVWHSQMRFVLLRIWAVSLLTMTLIRRCLTAMLLTYGIRSLVGFGTRLGALVHLVLYPRK